MFQAVHYFEADSLIALKGDGNNLGLGTNNRRLWAYRCSQPGQLLCRCHLAETRKIPACHFYFEDFSSDDILINPEGHSLMGDAYMELKDYASLPNITTRHPTISPINFFTLPT